jgi:protein SCO1/2
VLKARITRLALVAALLAAPLGCAGIARADGDPASDYLYGQSLFAPADAGMTDAQHAQLSRLIERSRAAGFRIKVAIVASPVDLGSVGALWKHPQAYARFLADELTQGYRGPLLVAMPNGFGLAGAHGGAAARAARLAAPGSVAAIGPATLGAIKSLASASGHPIPAESTTQSGNGRHAPSVWLVIAVLALIGSLVLFIAAYPSQRKLAKIVVTTGLAIVGLTAAGVIFTKGNVERETAVAGPHSIFAGSTMPPGVRAPDFALRDQDGRVVRMSDYRGRPVVVTFLYTHCRNLCPITAQLVRGALDDVGKRVPALAISVDPRRDTPASARRFLTKQHVRGRIDYLLGSYRRLARVWRAFAIQPQTKNLEHQSWITLVDAKGFVRVGEPTVETTPELLAHDIRVLQR